MSIQRVTLKTLEESIEQLINIEHDVRKDAIRLITGDCPDYLNVDDFDDFVGERWDEMVVFSPATDLYKLACDYVVMNFGQLKDYLINNFDDLQEVIKDLQEVINEMHRWPD